MRPVLPALLALSLAVPAAAADPYPPLRAAPPAGAGRHIQRSMRLLADSTPENRNTVRVLFYGQSITEQKWAARVLADLKHRFPHADIVSENRALAGFSSQLLVKTAETDLYPFQPDLLIFHVYGAHNTYEDIVRRTRERTTADILIQTDHVTKPADFAEETDAAKLPPRGDHWDAFMNHNWLPAVAKKYDAELCDQRTLWKQYLTANKLEPKALLSDNVHLNAHGEYLMAECVKAYLRYDPTLTPDPKDTRVTTPEPAGPRGTSPARIIYGCDGTRVDVVFKRDSKPGAKVTVRIAALPPSEHRGTYALTRALSPAAGKWPVVAPITCDAWPVVEDWSMRARKDPADPKRLLFTVTGSVTGPDGDGSSDEPFLSKSRRVKIAPADWNADYAFRLAGKPVPDSFTVNWKVVSHARDTAVRPAVAPGVEPSVTVAQGLPNVWRPVELTGDVDAVAAVRAYRPPLVTK